MLTYGGPPRSSAPIFLTNLIGEVRAGIHRTRKGYFLSEKQNCLEIGIIAGILLPFLLSFLPNTMAKFNTASAIRTKTHNLAGGEAFIESPKLEFVSILLTSFVQDQFYRSEGGGIQRIVDLLNAIPDKKFAAKAALYARNEFGMRSVTHLVAAALAAQVKGEEWTKAFFDKVIHRPDDMTEILALVQKPVPNALKKGFATALARFDEYQLAKYRREGSDVSLVDVVNLVHPKNTEAIKKLVAGTLKSTETWEAKLSSSGKAESDEEKAELKGAAWKELIAEKKIGYFALLKNLRNIIQQADPETIQKAFEMLQDEKLIKKSLVLPFRYLTAMEEIAKTNDAASRQTMVAISKALDIATANVPKLPGKTLVALDISSSMTGRVREIASLFAAIILKANDADLIRFWDTASYQTINPLDSTTTIANSIAGAQGGTNFHSVFEEANHAYDRIVILSDMQGWIGGGAPSQSVAEYKRRTGANPHIYSFDMAGYGTLQFPEPQVYALAGFSDKIFDIMKLLEQDKNALIHTIEKVEL